MLNIKEILNCPDFYLSKLKVRNFDLNVDKLKKNYDKINNLQNNLETLNHERNQNAKLIGQAKSQGKDIEPLVQKTSSFNAQIHKLKLAIHKAESKLNKYLHQIPNIAHPSVPEGDCENNNQEISCWGKPRKFDFPIKDHVDLGNQLGYLDFNLASKITGSRFSVMKGDFVKLHRALIHFMIDCHTQNGYEEIYVPYLVNADCLFYSGQLPKFEHDLFKTTLHADQGDHQAKKKVLYLIPTAEVSLVNIVANEILEAKNLPLKFVAHSPCFRSEAGSYGKDTRGLIRQHQFEKVEMVHICHPDHSYDQLEIMRRDAENILQKLELPYRCLVLSTGDMGFSAAKTYDLEVWIPSQNNYREISSCSNTEDFQARRMLARFKNPQNGKNELIHTLNGSGLAVGRTLLAIVENYQNKDGSITIPEILKTYMSGQTIIK